MNTYWFKKTGWFYMPVHRMGIIITLLAFLFMLPVCMAVIRNGHSVTDDLYQIFVFGSCTAFWWQWIAGNTSKN